MQKQDLLSRHTSLLPASLLLTAMLLATLLFCSPVASAQVSSGLETPAAAPAAAEGATDEHEGDAAASPATTAPATAAPSDAEIEPHSDAPADSPPAAVELDADEARSRALTHYAVARQLLQAGRLRPAIAEYRKAAELDPGSVTVKMELASALLTAGDRAEAKVLYEQIVEQHEQADEAHFQLARMALGQRDADGARRHFEQILSAAASADEERRQGNRFYPLALYYLALSSDEKNDHSASVDHFHKLVVWLGKADESFRRDREIGRLLQILPQLVAKTAQLHLIQRQPEMAVSVVRDSAPQMLADHSFSAALVNSLVSGKHLDLALEVALLVQGHRPDEAVSYDLVGRVFEALDDRPGYIAKLRELIAANPGSVIIQLVLGERLLESDDADQNIEAVALIEQVMETTDGKAEAASDRLLRSLIDKLLERKRADLALSMAENIRRRQPNEIAPYYLLERIHRERGGDEAIAESFRTYLAERSGMPVIRLILGKALLKVAGEGEEGLKLIEPLADRASGVSEAARESLVVHYRQQDDAGRIVRLLGRTVNEQYDQGGAMYRLLSFIDTLEDKQELYERATSDFSGEIDRREAQGVHFILGLLSELDDPESAATHYEKSIEAQAKFLLGYERLSALYMRQDRLMNALDTLRNALYAGSQGGVFFRRMGVVYELVDRDIDAIATYRTAMRIDSEIVPTAQYRLANVLARIGQVEEGMKLLREAVEANPEEIYAWYNLALYQMERKLADEALATVDRALVLMADRPQLNYIKALMLLEDRRYDMAALLIDDLAADEDFAEIAGNLRVSMLVGQRKYDDAEAAVGKMLLEKPEDVSLLHTLSSIKHISGNNAEAEQILQGILEKHPRDPRANNDLGYMWADRGHNVIESERMIRTALQEDPESSAYLDSLGWVLYKQGRMEEALVYLRRSVRLDNDVDPIVYDHLADALMRTGQDAEALKYYQKVRKALDEHVGRPYSYEHALLDKKIDAKLQAIRENRPVPMADVVPLPRQQEQKQQASPRKQTSSQPVTGER